MDIGWRMGAGESHMMMFHHATKAWSTDDRRALLVAAGPVPADWAFWVVDWLDLPGAWDDPELGPYALAFDHVKEQLNVLGVVVSGRPSEESTATNLTDHPIHLGLGATAVPQPRFTGMEWYADYVSRAASDGEDGRLVSMFTFDAPWDSWEMHPKGHEVVICTAGKITLVQEIDGEQVRTTLSGGEYAINPPGVWHTVDVDSPATALFITAGIGTEHKSR